jgi:NAD(P)-dependent dehydrogenase (short-subunit alcohol dehydrogenase family)
VSGSFDGKHVLVTGASRGIGYGVADAFAREGAQVTLLADDAAVTEAAQRLAEHTGTETAALRCDISDRAAVREALSSLGRVDVLVNNAGLERITPLLEPGEEAEATFRRIIDINVLGTYYVTREAAPLMPRGGRIIMTSSIWGRSAVAEFGAYCASKHAVIGFMRSLAHELAPRGITVNAVCPGWVRTEASMRSLRAMAERQAVAPEALLDEIVGVQALPGLMEPADVAGAYLFLAGPQAASITGQTLNVDRGEQMC